MNQDPARDAPENDPAERYDVIEFAECVVVYERENPSGWLQSDATVSLADWQ